MEIGINLSFYVNLALYRALGADHVVEVADTGRGEAEYDK
jgi:hypothetical protein